MNRESNKVILNPCDDMLINKVIIEMNMVDRFISGNMSPYMEYDENFGFKYNSIGMNPIKKIYNNGKSKDIHCVKFNSKTNKNNWLYKFYSNGNISLCKTNLGNKKNKKEVLYKCDYNLLQTNLNIVYTSLISNIFDLYEVNLDDNLLKFTYNGLEIVKYINNNQRFIHLSDVECFDNSLNSGCPFKVEYHFCIDELGRVSRSLIVVNLFNKIGKFDGMYILDVSLEKGIKAKFVSSKGEKIDALKDGLLMNHMMDLILACCDQFYFENSINGTYDNVLKMMVLDIFDSIMNRENDDYIIYDGYVLKEFADIITAFSNNISEIKGEIPDSELKIRILKVLRELKIESNFLHRIADSKDSKYKIDFQKKC